MATSPRRLTRRQLHSLVWKRPLKELAPDLGLSANGLAKICDRVAVPRPSRAYWSKPPERRDPAPRLPAAPEGCDSEIVIGDKPARSRRARKRLSRTERLLQIADAASELILADGVQAATIKRVAAKAGISEALAHRYFPSQTDMLIFLAKREETDRQETQQRAIPENAEYWQQAEASLGGYFDYILRRSVLFELLLTNPAVRDALHEEMESRLSWGVQGMSRNLSRSFGAASQATRAGALLARALSVRAGHLLAEGRISKATAMELTLSILKGGLQQVAESAEPQASASD